MTTSTNNVFRLLSVTHAIWAVEGGGGYYYMGMMGGKVTPRHVAGVAYIGVPVNFSKPSSYVIGHELGHNMSLQHAPCGNPAWTDLQYPYPDGSTGAWGYDFDTDSLVPTSHRDLMSYCSPKWISDYHFTNATGYRIKYDVMAKSSPQPGKSLLLWGGRNAGGSLFLEPAFVVDAPPLTPNDAGDFRLAGRTDGGRELFSLSFDMPETADADGYTSFAFTLPVGPGWEDLEKITLYGPGGTFTLDSDTHRPAAIVREPETGQVQALILDLHPDTRTPEDAAKLLGVAPNLTLRFSLGIPGPNAWH